MSTFIPKLDKHTFLRLITTAAAFLLFNISSVNFHITKHQEEKWPSVNFENTNVEHLAKGHIREREEDNFKNAYNDRKGML
jgi:hypothetical protein